MRLPSGIAHTIFDRVDAAHFDARGARRGVGRHALRSLLIDCGVQISAQLFVEFAFRSTFADECAETRNEAAAQRHHTPRGVAFRMRAIAEVCISQSRASRLSRARPSAVSL